jgi:hypothetical protein
MTLAFLAATAAMAEPILLDCVPGTPGVSEITIAGDGAFRLPNGKLPAFTGFADPCIRKDPATGALWLAYSWPNQHLGSGSRTPGIDTHLACTTDGGRSFSFVKALWPSLPAQDPRGRLGPGFIESEAANILPVVSGGKLSWYGVRLNYFIPTEGGAARKALDSFVIRISEAASPEALSDAPSGLLGARLSSRAWKVDQDLSKLDPDLADADFWNEPALCYQDGRLYLALVAFSYGRDKRPVMARNNIQLFSTKPEGPPASWRWEYSGRLAGAEEAAELGGQRLSQCELARGEDGRLLLLATPDDWDDALRDFNHKGCVVLVVDDLSKARLARAPDGRLEVRARVTVSDSLELGSAAAAYDPASSTGLLLTRRTKTRTEFSISFWRTGLHL